MSKKRKYKCAVDGVVIVFGYPGYPRGLSGICAKSSVTVNSETFCLAHGNKKCRHKIKLESKEQ